MNIRISTLNKFMYLFVLMSSMLFTGCSKMIISSNHNVNPKITIESKINELVNPLIEKKENIGIVVGIYNNKKASIYNYGHKDNLNGTIMKKDTIFAVGSSGKPIIISLLLVLENKRYLSLDEKIKDILPAHIKYKDANVGNITLSELASHTSGLPREPKSLPGLLLAIKHLFNGNNIYSYINKEYMYEYLSNLKINKVSKNNKAIYSNIGIGLLGHLLTIKMNQSLDELLLKYMYKPLKMKNTTYNLNKNQKEKIATGHVGDFPIFMKKNKVLKNWNFSDFMQGTAGLYSNAEDLIMYLQANLGESNTELDLILKKSHKILSKDDKLFYTLGWQVDYIQEYNIYLYYKYGVVAGFSCYMGMELNSKTAVVVLKNNLYFEDNIGHEVLLNMALSHIE